MIDSFSSFWPWEIDRSHTLFIVDDHILDEVAGKHCGVTHLVGALVLGVEEAERPAHGGRMLGRNLVIMVVWVNGADGELGEEGDDSLAVCHS